MNIASAYSLAQTQFTTELEPDKRRNVRSGTGSRGDTVSFSDEAIALAAAMAEQKEAEKAGKSSAFERNPHGDTDEESPELTEGAAQSAGASGPSSGDLEAQIKKLAEQIEQLMQQMSTISSGAGSETEKTVQCAPLQKRISGLEKQMQELLAQKRAQDQQQQQKA